ncbi:Hypothetical predicted protein [Prunus dulcis]|uniref:Uncharacterized protein n=1 Tax=Prunus dulcis TaxID=3755 RepID=A0A5E4GH74_PRUDU|nr:Hypothetical predicted protein [Prunus dulcis]
MGRGPGYKASVELRESKLRRNPICKTPKDSNRQKTQGSGLLCSLHISNGNSPRLRPQYSPSSHCYTPATHDCSKSWPPNSINTNPGRQALSNWAPSFNKTRLLQVSSSISKSGHIMQAPAPPDAALPIPQAPAPLAAKSRCNFDLVFPSASSGRSRVLLGRHASSSQTQLKPLAQFQIQRSSSTKLLQSGLQVLIIWLPSSF